MPRLSLINNKVKLAMSKILQIILNVSGASLRTYVSAGSPKYFYLWDIGNNTFILFILFFSTTGLVPCSATPTTFGDLRAANGQGQQRRRITSVQPPTGLQEWLKMFQVTVRTLLECSPPLPGVGWEYTSIWPLTERGVCLMLCLVWAQETVG